MQRVVHCHKGEVVTANDAKCFALFNVCHVVFVGSYMQRGAQMAPWHTSKVVMGMKFAGHVVDSNLIEACDNVCGSWQLYAYMHNAAGQQPQLQSCGNVHVVLQDYTLYQ
jgi:hypothetical protein